VITGVGEAEGCAVETLDGIGVGLAEGIGAAEGIGVAVEVVVAWLDVFWIDFILAAYTCGPSIGVRTAVYLVIHLALIAFFVYVDSGSVIPGKYV